MIFLKFSPPNTQKLISNTGCPLWLKYILCNVSEQKNEIISVFSIKNQGQRIPIPSCKLLLLQTECRKITFSYSEIKQNSSSKYHPFVSVEFISYYLLAINITHN